MALYAGLFLNGCLIYCVALRIDSRTQEIRLKSSNHNNFLLQLNCTCDKIDILLYDDIIYTRYIANIHTITYVLWFPLKSERPFSSISPITFVSMRLPCGGKQHLQPEIRKNKD